MVLRAAVRAFRVGRVGVGRVRAAKSGVRTVSDGRPRGRSGRWRRS